MSIEVQTTQNVIIDYEPAGVGSRMLAYFIDYLIIFVWFFSCFGIRYLYTHSFLLGSGIILYIIVLFPIIFYDLLFEVFNKGQTPAKMLMKIRVINIDGTTPSPIAYLLRWLFRLVDMIILGGSIAFITIIFTKNSQRLGDLIAKTTVISLRMDDDVELSMEYFDYKDDYAVTYHDVVYKLSDNDIRTIKSMLNGPKMNDAYITKLTDKIKSVTGYKSDSENAHFLARVVRDYNYLTSK